MLSSVARRSGSLGLALLEITAVLRILCIPAFQQYYKSTLLADELRDQVDQIYEKEKKKDIATKLVSKLMVSTGYPSLGMVTYSFVIVLAGIFLTLPFLAGGSNLELDGISAGFWDILKDLTAVPIKILVSGTSDFNTLITCFVAPFLVGASTYYHDKVFSQHSIVVRSSFDSVLLIAAIAASILLPLSFSIYWSVVECIGIVQSWYVRRFLHVTVKKKV